MMSLVSDVFGPIFAKELVEMSRRWRYYLSRIAFGSVLLLVLFVVHENMSLALRYRQMSVAKAMATMAEVFFLTVCWVQYLAVYVFVPLFLSGVISGEREQKTLELLFTTQLSDREIVWGKLGSRVMTLLMIILSGLPVVAIMMLFGGVNPGVLSRVAIATLLALLFVSAFSIYFSATTRSPLGALVRTYWWLAFWLVLAPLFVVMATEGLLRGTPSSRSISDVVLTTLLAVNPFGSFMAAVVDDVARQLQRVLGSWYFWPLLIGPASWAGYLIWRTVRLVRIDPGPGRLRAFFLRVLRASLGWMIPKRRSGQRTPWFRPERAWLVVEVTNPFWLRARRVAVYDREGHLRRIQLGGWILTFFFFLLIAFVALDSFDDSSMSMAFQSFAWLGIGLLVALVAGYSLMGERRRGFFDLVLITPLLPSEIIWGTFLSVWRHVSIIFLLILVLNVFFLISGASWVPPGIGSFILGALFMSVLIYHGIACSLAAGTIPGALIGTFCLPLVMVVGLPFLIGFGRGANGPVLWTICAVSFPLACLLVYLRKTVARVAFFSIALHLSITALFTCWTWSNRPGFSVGMEYPAAAAHPAYLIICSLERLSWNVTERMSAHWMGILVSYGVAQIVNLLLLHLWLCGNFDRLTGRKNGRGTRRRRSGVPSGEHTIVLPPQADPGAMGRSPVAEIPLK